MTFLFLQIFWLSFSRLLAQSDDCRILEFKSAMKGYHLHGHVFKSADVKNETDCDAKCYVESNCISFNIVSSPADGAITCELSNSDHEMHPEALERQFGAVYQPIKNACLGNPCLPHSSCQNGYTDKGYRCKQNALPTTARQTTQAPGTTQASQTTQVPKTTQAPQTTQAPGTTQVPQTTQAPGTTQTLATTKASLTTQMQGTTQEPQTTRETSQVRQTTQLPEIQLTLYIGQNKTIFCPVSTDQDSTIGWLYNGDKVLPGGVASDGTKGLKITSVKLSHEGKFTCVVKSSNSSSFQAAGDIVLQVSYPETCSRIKANISDVSDWYIIDPDGPEGKASFQAYCNMTDKRGAGVTVIGHDTENRTHVDGCDPKGCYTRDVTYTAVLITQLEALTDVSAYCEQYISYECKNSKLVHDGTAWWESRGGRKMEYWGGTTKKHECGCASTSSCADPKKKCNCQVEDNTWREDSGLLTDKKSLPVSRLRFGDTGKVESEGYHTLGKLKCLGISTTPHQGPTEHP